MKIQLNTVAVAISVVCVQIFILNSYILYTWKLVCISDTDRIIRVVWHKAESHNKEVVRIKIISAETVLMYSKYVQNESYFRYSCYVNKLAYYISFITMLIIRVRIKKYCFINHTFNLFFKPTNCHVHSPHLLRMNIN